VSIYCDFCCLNRDTCQDKDRYMYCNIYNYGVDNTCGSLPQAQKDYYDEIEKEQQIKPSEKEEGK